MTRRFWRLIFASKALLNWLESIGLVVVDPWLRARLGLQPIANWDYVFLFVSQAFVFGMGYWSLSRQPDSNPELIRMAIYAQYSVFFILLSFVVAGSLNIVYLLPAVVDGIYASLFLFFWIKCASR